MKVSGLCKSTDEIIKQSALSISRKIYKELFSWSKNENINSLVNNTLLVNLGLIKVMNLKLVILIMQFYKFIFHFLE